MSYRQHISTAPPKGHHQGTKLKQRLLGTIALTLLATLSSVQMASAEEPNIEWEKRQNAEERLTAFGTGLLGDGIDPHTGSISFNTLDVSLPGNFALEVAVRRKLSQGFRKHESVENDFGDWELDVPKIKVTSIGDWTGNRCSADFATSFPSVTFGRGPLLTNDQYSQGVMLEIPGRGSQQILEKDSAAPFPAEATHVTLDNTYFTCVQASDGDEGFEAKTADGTTYTFDRHISYRAKDMGSVGGIQKQRTVNTLVATLVTDRNGNTVSYDYDSLDRLTKIEASDGRVITLSYLGNSKLIDKVSTNNRDWNYNYGTVDFERPDWDPGFNTPLQYKVLETVTQPDGKAWTYSLDAMAAEPAPNESCNARQYSLTVTHPYGTTGIFNIQDTRHRYVLNNLMSRSNTCPNIEPEATSPGPPQFYFTTRTGVMSVTSKTLSGTNMPDSTWNYAYEQDQQPGGVDEDDDRTNRTIVAGPGAINTYYHAWVGEPLGGKLVRSQTKELGTNTILSESATTYEYEAPFGNTFAAGGNSWPGSTRNPIRTIKIEETREGTLIEQGTPNSEPPEITKGDVFTQEIVFETDFANANYSYGFPTETRSYSNLTLEKSRPPRITNTTYAHNEDNWVLGLVSNIDVNGRNNVSSFMYDSLGRMTRKEKYGHLELEFDHNADGTLNWFKDGENNQTTLENWHRGTAQTVILPQNKRGSTQKITIERVIDDNGRMTLSKDGRGNQTDYQYDPMGRLTGLTPPLQSPTTVTYDFTTNPVQTITRGDRVETIEYDSLFRPIKTNIGGEIFTRLVYNGAGQAIFTSLPSDSAAATAGTNMTYDGLGRIKTATNANNDVITTSYHRSHKKRVEDPTGAYTDYYSYGWAGPDNEEYRAIFEGKDEYNIRNTGTIRNVWGELERVWRWGDLNGHDVEENQYLFYDDRRRLCRYRTNEGGDTIYKYDNKGQVSGYSKGQGSWLDACASAFQAYDVNLTYDAIGRLTKTDFNSSSVADINRTYDDDGNLLILDRGTVDWTYDYNAVSQLENETLTAGSKTFSIDYAYDNDGQLDSKTLPSGRVIDYTRDDIGRMITLDDSGTALASNIEWHANGLASGFNYGNGIVFNQSLTPLMQPLNVGVTFNGNGVLNREYVYEPRGLIEEIKETNAPEIVSQDQFFTYDLLGQLKTANGLWGTGSFDYDSLGNIREKTLGDRTVAMRYNVRNHVSEYVDTQDCTKEESIQFIGGNGSGTIWNHEAETNKCNGTLERITTTSFNENMTPVKETYEFTDLAVGESQTLSGQSVDTAGTTFTTELRANRYTDTSIMLEHRSSPNGGAWWSNWVYQGTLNLSDNSDKVKILHDNRGNMSSQKAQYTQCTDMQTNDFEGQGGTTWSHAGYFDSCRDYVYNFKTISLQPELSPKRTEYRFPTIWKGRSHTITRNFTDDAGVSYRVELKATYLAQGELELVHRTSTDNGVTWTNWIDHGSIALETHAKADKDISFTHDVSDQMKTVSGDATATYWYDGNMKRVMSQVDGNTIYNVFDASGSLVHIEDMNAAKKTDYIAEAGLSVARITKNAAGTDTVTYLHNDHLGSASTATTQAGTLKWDQRYTPYGEELTSINDNADQAGFTGHIKDSVTGLNYMQARYYDPVIGRFLSVDPVTFIDTYNPAHFNRYVYANGNPILFVDATGKKATIYSLELRGSIAGESRSITIGIGHSFAVNTDGSYTEQVGLIGTVGGSTSTTRKLDGIDDSPRDILRALGEVFFDTGVSISGEISEFVSSDPNRNKYFDSVNLSDLEGRGTELGANIDYGVSVGFERGENKDGSIISNQVSIGAGAGVLPVNVTAESTNTKVISRGMTLNKKEGR